LILRLRVKAAELAALGHTAIAREKGADAAFGFNIFTAMIL